MQLNLLLLRLDPKLVDYYSHTSKRLEEDIMFVREDPFNKSLSELQESRRGSVLVDTAGGRIVVRFED